MNQITLITIILTMVLAGCSKKNEYSIIGETNYTGKVYLNSAKGFNLSPIDSVSIENKTFNFKGNVASCDQYFLTFEAKKGAFGFFLDNEEIHIQVSDEHPYFSKVTKSKLNTEYQTFTSQLNELVKAQSEERKKYYAASEPAKRDSLLKLLQHYGSKQSDLAHTTFDQNIEKPYATTILMQYLKNSYSTDQLDSVLNKMSQKAKDNNAGRMLISEIKNTRRSAVGQPFINITQPSPNGEQISLQDILNKNQCVLIDFWASWCSPCIASMPEIKKVYETYKDQGFEIYAVSIDSNKEAWLNAIDKHELTWTHVSELKGWDIDAKEHYAVTGVPTTILIDKQGVIVARNLHGNELEEKIKECL